MKIYQHLSQEQRYQIEALLKAGKNKSSIAQLIGCHQSTICREIRRNVAAVGPGHTYTAQYAAYRIERRAQERYPYRRFNDRMRQQIVSWLMKEQFSPEIITQVGRSKYGEFVSHETIYQWIWQMKHSNKFKDAPYKDLYKYLKHHGRRRKRGNYKENRGRIPDRTSVEFRPSLIKDRNRVGDLEVDLVLGKNHSPGLLIITDRASRITRIRKVNSKKADYIAQRIINTLKPANEWIKTITYDNDLAFAQHNKVNLCLGTSSYFTHPYASHEKGTVENRIWQLRRFFPKGTDFNKVNQHQVKKVERLLNNRPVKKFKYLTPNAVFLQKSNVAPVT